MKKKLLGLLGAGALLLAACGGADQPAKESADGTVDESQVRPEMRVAINSEPPTLDPARTVSTASIGVTMHIYETLYTFDENFESQPVLADSYEVNDDNTKYTFKLKEGINFHDGSEMTAEDVAASMNYWKADTSKAADLLPEGDFEVVDDYTVEVEFVEPNTELLTLMSSITYFPAIRPAEAFDGEIAESGIDDNFIGTGPYEYVDWVHDQYVEVKRFDNYHNQVTGEPSRFAGEKRAPTETIRFEIVGDVGTRMAGLLSEEYDVGEVPVTNLDQVDATDYLNYAAPGGGTLVAQLNVEEGPLLDDKLRQAILTGINNNDIMLAALDNEEFYEVSSSYVSPETPYYTETSSEFYNANDQEKAKKLIEESGYNGEEIRIVTTPEYDSMYSASIALQDQLVELGLNAVVNQYDFNTFNEYTSDPSGHEIYIVSHSFQPSPQQVLTLSTDRWGGDMDEQAQELIDAMRAAEDEAATKETFAELQDFLYTDYIPGFVIGHYNNFVTYNSAVEGFDYWKAPILWNAGHVE